MSRVVVIHRVARVSVLQPDPLVVTVETAPQGLSGPNRIDDATAVGPLTSAAADALFLLAANSAGAVARKITLGAVGRSLLGAAAAQAGRLTLGVGNVSTSASNLTGDVYLGGVSNTEALSLNLWNSARDAYDTLTLDDGGWSFPRGIVVDGSVSSSAGFLGDGSGLSNLPPVAATGLTGATLAAGVTASSLTSVGTLTALAVSGVSVLTGGAYSMVGSATYGTTRYGRGAAPSVTPSSGPNTVIGEEAGGFLTTGNSNTLIGLQAGSSITTGVGNTVIGHQANVAAGGSYSTVIGFQASLAASVSSCIVLSGGSNVTHNNTVALGNNVVSWKDGVCALGPNQAAFALMQASSTSANRPVCEVQRAWADSTDATRAGRLTLHAYSVTTAQEGLRIDANSGGVRLGFFGGSAAAKPTVTGSRGGNAALASLLTALAGVGLLTDSSS